MKQHHKWEQDFRSKDFLTISQEEIIPEFSSSKEVESKKEWLSYCMDQLTEENQSLEADIERIKNGNGKINKKNEEIKKKQSQIKRHLFHIENLKKIREGLEDGRVNLEDIEGIEDNVNEYIKTGSV